VPVPEQLRPVFVLFTDIGDPKSARRVDLKALEASLGKGFHLRALSLDIVANGFWPVDFGGVLGEPVTRGIEAKLPWLNRADGAATALQAAGLKVGEGFTAEAAFTRK
jgi:hypothetical protein